MTLKCFLLSLAWSSTLSTSELRANVRMTSPSLIREDEVSLKERAMVCRAPSMYVSVNRTSLLTSSSLEMRLPLSLLKKREKAWSIGTDSGRHRARKAFCGAGGAGTGVTGCGGRGEREPGGEVTHAMWARRCKRGTYYRGDLREGLRDLAVQGLEVLFESGHHSLAPRHAPADLACAELQAQAHKHHGHIGVVDLDPLDLPCQTVVQARLHRKRRTVHLIRRIEEACKRAKKLRQAITHVPLRPLPCPVSTSYLPRRFRASPGGSMLRLQHLSSTCCLDRGKFPDSSCAREGHKYAERECGELLIFTGRGDSKKNNERCQALDVLGASKPVRVILFFFTIGLERVGRIFQSSASIPAGSLSYFRLIVILPIVTSASFTRLSPSSVVSGLQRHRLP